MFFVVTKWQSWQTPLFLRPQRTLSLCHFAILLTAFYKFTIFKHFRTFLCVLISKSGAKLIYFFEIRKKIAHLRARLIIRCSRFLKKVLILCFKTYSKCQVRIIYSITPASSQESMVAVTSVMACSGATSYSAQRALVREAASKEP